MPLTIWFPALFLNDLVDPLVQVFVLAGYLESREKMRFENTAVCPSEFKPARGAVLQIPWKPPALPQGCDSDVGLGWFSSVPKHLVHSQELLHQDQKAN